MRKQTTLNLRAEESGELAQVARKEEFEFLHTMDIVELNSILLALLAIVKLEEKPAADRCKYLVGTSVVVMMVKSNKIMVRVGGGFATIEEHIRQVGPFECIKIYKQMKGNPERNQEPMGFKDAVNFCLVKHKATEKIIKEYLKSDDDDQQRLFEAAIE